MTIKSALKFIERGIRDDELRNRLNTANTIADRDEILAAENLTFSDHDFDEAFQHRLTRCRESEDADALIAFKMWWDALTRTISPGLCDSCGT